MTEKKDEDEAEASWISEFVDIESSNFESPIDLNIGRMTKKILRSLIRCNYDILPTKLKLTNTGKTVVLSAKWQEEIPFVAGGPFLSRHVFSQIHFHWGPNDMDGSDHSVDGESLPMELHAVHFNSDYTSHQVAMHKSDGISILVYFFKSMENSKIDGIVKSLRFIEQAQTSTRIVPWPMSNLLRSFVDDYFLYRGSLSTNNYRHIVTWLISREPIGISIQQVAEFRKLKSKNLEPLGRKNHRVSGEMKNQIVHHVNPSGSMYSSLLPISRSLLPSRISNCNNEKFGENSKK